MSSPLNLGRRRHPRYLSNLELLAEEISSFERSSEAGTEIFARIRNISSGGLCFSCSNPFELHSLLRCEIFLPGYSVAIPTLTHTRWIGNDLHTLVVGVQFLL
jgi:hypothetical protein